MDNLIKIPLVSVIIPCYNHGEYIDETIKSVLRQSYKSFEIIIVDAGSDDLYTRKKLSSFSSPQIRIVTSENRIYPSEARNLAFKASEGDFILTLDADDMIHESFMEKTVGALTGDSRAGAASSKVLYFGYEDGILDYRGGMLEDNLINMGSHLCAMIRRTVWEEIGGFDENMTEGYEDWEFWIRLTKSGWSIVILDELLFYYRQKESSRVTDVFQNHEKITRDIQNKHRDIFIHPYNFLKKMLAEKKR